MRSSDINQQVVKELELYAPVYNKGTVRVEELYKANSPVHFQALNSATLNSWATYFFTMDWANKKVLIDNKSVRFDSVVLLDNNYFRLLVNHGYNTAVVGKNFFVQFMPVSAAAGGIIGGISANPLSSASTIINVQIQTPVAEKGQNILTKLFEIYNRKAIEDKNQIAIRTLNFVEDRLSTVMYQLDSVERNIASFKSRESFVGLGSEASDYFGSVKTLDAKSSELDLQLSMLNDLNNYVRNKENKRGTVPSLLLVSDPTLSSLLSTLYNSEFELEKARSVSGEKSDAVIQAEDKIGLIKTDILVLNERNCSAITVRFPCKITIGSLDIA